MNIQSPFMNDIPECKLIMRRLRKKISKYTTAHKEIKKPRDQSHDILNILKSRNLPSFIVQTIKKRRTFDLLSLKNVVINGQSSLEQMKRLTSNQENQVQSMFIEHKQRVRKNKDRPLPKLERRSTACSSTEQEQSSESDSMQISNQFFEENSLLKEQKTENNQITSQGSHSFGEDEPVFHGRDFLSFQGQIYSEEEWLKF